MNTGSPRIHQFNHDTNSIWSITYFNAMNRKFVIYILKYVLLIPWDY